MDSALDNHERAKSAFRASWHHLKELFAASSPAAAWQSFKKMVDALPAWALVLIVAFAAALYVNRSFVLIPLALGGFFLAIYFIVKHAVRAALEEHDRRA